MSEGTEDIFFGFMVEGILGGVYLDEERTMIAAILCCSGSQTVTLSEESFLERNCQKNGSICCYSERTKKTFEIIETKMCSDCANASSAKNVESFLPYSVNRVLYSIIFISRQ